MNIRFVDPITQKAISEGVHSEDNLLDRLSEIRATYSARLDHPIGVDLIAENGDYLSVGLGAEESIIFYYPADGGGWALYSLGDENAKGTVVYYFCQWTELSRKYAIPWKKTEVVVIDWFRNQKKSDAIRWTAEIF